MAGDGGFDVPLVSVGQGNQDRDAAGDDVVFVAERDQVAALKSLTLRLLDSTERFSKGEYDKVSSELHEYIEDPVFLDLPREYRANIVAIAGKCAYELERWEALDEFITLLEAEYDVEDALPKVLEA